MFFEQLLNGLTLGCMYALIALGYTLIFGVIQVIFFAQGELSMVSAFISIGVFSFFSHFTSVESPWILLPSLFMASILGTSLIGVAAERIAIRPIRNSHRTKQLLTSLGMSIILQNIVFLTISSGNVAFPPLISPKVLSIGSFTFSSIQLFIILSSFLFMLLLDIFVRNTRLGLAMRATAESHKLARLMGININKTIMLTFIIGSSLASISGVMMGLYDGVAKYDMGFAPGIKAFTAAILGGIGNVIGGMLGGILIGLVESFGAGYISAEYKDFFAFIILIIILVLKPSGILGERISKID